MSLIKKLCPEDIEIFLESDSDAYSVDECEETEDEPELRQQQQLPPGSQWQCDLKLDIAALSTSLQEVRDPRCPDFGGTVPILIAVFHVPPGYMMGHTSVPLFETFGLH
jgi:hypothetical protein